MATGEMEELQVSWKRCPTILNIATLEGPGKGRDMHNITTFLRIAPTNAIAAFTNLYSQDSHCLFKQSMEKRSMTMRLQF